MRSFGENPVPEITVRVGAAPDPHVLPAIISARLAGRPVPAGPEGAVADAIARRVRERGSGGAA